MQLFLSSLFPHICALIGDLPWGHIMLQWKMMRGQPWDAPLLEQEPWGSKFLCVSVCLCQRLPSETEMISAGDWGGGEEIPASSYPVASK